MNIATRIPTPDGVVCKHCGEYMEGDGYTTVLHCGTIEAPSDVEPDADPIYCEPNNTEEV